MARAKIDVTPDNVPPPLYIKATPLDIDRLEENLNRIALRLADNDPAAAAPLVIEAKTRIKLLKDLQEMEDSCVWQGQRAIKEVNMECTIKVADYENIKLGIVATDTETARIALIRGLSTIGRNAKPEVEDHIQKFIEEILE